MTVSAPVSEIHNIIVDLTGATHGLRSEDFLIETDHQNAFLVVEENGFADIAVCFQKRLLEEMSKLELPRDFSLDHIHDVSVMVEEVSHFNYYCERAQKNQIVSPIEMEIQAEIDKFAFALDCLEKKNELQFEDQVFEVMFGELTLGDWVKPEEEEIYRTAHSIARSYCRKLMDETKAGLERREWFRGFYQLDSIAKIKGHRS